MQSKLRAPGQPRRSSVCTERLRSGCPTPFSGSTGVSVPWIATDTVAAKPCRRLNTGYHLDDDAFSSNRSRLLQAAPISSDPEEGLPDDLEQLQQRHDRLANEMDELAEEIEQLRHQWKSQQQI